VTADFRESPTARTWSLGALSAALALVSPLPAFAQDLRTVQPQPVPPPLDAPAPPDTATESYGVLRGVQVLTDPVQLQKQGVAVEGIAIDDTAALPGAPVRAALAPFIGKPLDLALLDDMRAALAQALLDGGERFARVVVPAQEVPGGAVQLLVLRGRAGTIEVAGAKYFSEASYRRELHIEPGDSIDHAALDADIDWLNRNPFRHVQLVTRPGATAGEVDLTLQTAEQRPLRVYGGINNSGTSSTGYGRAFVGLNWGNAFGLGHQLGYQHTHSIEDWDLFRSDSVNYTVPLPWRHLLTASASVGHVRSRVPEPLDQRGKSSAFSLRYLTPLVGKGSFRHELTLGLDYKRSDNNLLFAQVPVFGAATDIMQASVGYSASLEDAGGVTAMDVTLVLSPGDISDRNTDTAFQAQRAGARARYTYLNAGLNRHTRLPGDFTWVLDLRGQVASTNLLGSEQLAIGGAGSVRGFDEGQVYVDEGLVVRNELRHPPMAVLRRLGGKLADQMQLLWFVDYGLGFVHSPLPGERSRYSLASVGFGVRYQLANYLDFRLDHGVQIGDPGSDPRGRHYGTHVGLTLSW